SAAAVEDEAEWSRPNRVRRPARRAAVAARRPAGDPGASPTPPRHLGRDFRAFFFQSRDACPVTSGGVVVEDALRQGNTALVDGLEVVSGSGGPGRSAFSPRLAKPLKR